VTGPHASGLYHFYRLQPTAVRNVTTPELVINTWYDILPQTANCNMFWCKVWNSPANSIETRWIIDGTTYTWTTAALNNTWYSIYRDPTGQGDVMNDSADGAGMYPCMYWMGFEGRQVQVSFRVLLAVGAGDRIIGSVTYGVL